MLECIDGVFYLNGVEVTQAEAEAWAATDPETQRLKSYGDARLALNNAIRLHENAPYTPAENDIIAQNTIDEAIALYKSLAEPVPLDVGELANRVMAYERKTL